LQLHHNLSFETIFVYVKKTCTIVIFPIAETKARFAQVTQNPLCGFWLRAILMGIPFPHSLGDVRI